MKHKLDKKGSRAYYAVCGSPVAHIILTKFSTLYRHTHTVCLIVAFFGVSIRDKISPHFI